MEMLLIWGAIMSAGIEIRAYALPELQINEICRTVPDAPCFYIARDFKKFDTEEFNKTMYTRIVGAVFYPHRGRGVLSRRGLCGIQHARRRYEMVRYGRMQSGGTFVDLFQNERGYQRGDVGASVGENTGYSDANIDRIG